MIIGGYKIIISLKRYLLPSHCFQCIYDNLLYSYHNNILVKRSKELYIFTTIITKEGLHFAK